MKRVLQREKTDMLHLHGLPFSELWLVRRRSHNVMMGRVPIAYSPRFTGLTA
jgi:hypothetical protein